MPVPSWPPWVPCPSNGSPTISGVPLRVSKASASLWGVALGFAFVPMAFVKTGSFLAAASWMSIFPILALVLLVAVAMGPKPPVFVSEQTGEPTNADGDFKLAAKLPVFYIGILCVFFTSWIMQAFNDLTPVYLSAQSSPGGLATVCSWRASSWGLVQLSLMIGSLLQVGIILEKLFRENTKAAVGTAFVLFAVFAYLVKSPAIAGNLKVLPLVLFLVGFFEGWIIPNCLAFISMNFPAHNRRQDDRHLDGSGHLRRHCWRHRRLNPLAQDRDVLRLDRRGRHRRHLWLPGLPLPDPSPGVQER